MAVYDGRWSAIGGIVLTWIGSFLEKKPATK